MTVLRKYPEKVHFICRLWYRPPSPNFMSNGISVNIAAVCQTGQLI